MPRIRARVLELLKKYGRNTTSFQILEPGLQYWFGDDSCVAYADTGGSWVVAGGPIAERNREHDAMVEFSEAARAAGRRVRFFGLEEAFESSQHFATIHMGQQPIWNPQLWHSALSGKRSLREQLRRARAKGVRVRQVEPADLSDEEHPTRKSIDALIAHWMNSCAMAPMGFVVHLDPYNLPDERRFLIAECNDDVVGIFIAVPIYALGGWFFEDVLRDPSAPNGTVELMFDFAMNMLANDGCEHVTFGLAPLAGTDHRWIRRIRDHTRWLYDFEGLRAFKAKLQPTGWHDVYLGFPVKERGIRAVIDTLAAFARGSFIRFGLRTLVHRAPLVTRWLALLLLPWTALLAVAPTAKWFPSRAVQLGWIGFDVLLFLLLWNLAGRWRKKLALTLSVAALADFATGCAQLALYNARTDLGIAGWLVVLTALGAPLGAGLFLWLARNRGQQYATISGC